MDLNWDKVIAFMDRLAPQGSSRRKILHILSIILIFEGISVIILFSYFGLLVGLASLLIGFILLLTVRPPPSDVVAPDETETIGVKLLAKFTNLLGAYGMALLGVLIVVLVIIYNGRISQRPEYGDLDTLSLLLGGLLIVFPFLARKYFVTVGFALIFVAIVVIILVVPQFLVASSGGGGVSRAGNWYVEYMLAAPFATILDLIGIPASSSGDTVTIQFADGTVHPLGISAYCAGLYSFSIFVAAFISYVLVFENFRPKIMGVVLASGLLLAYLGNLFRMVIIGIVGYYEGIKALLWTHENVGWVIFLSWSAVFWYLVIRYADTVSSKGITDAN